MKKITLSILVGLMILACNEDPGSVNMEEGKVTFGVKYVNNAPLLKSSNKSQVKAGIDSITVDRARFLLRNISLKSSIEDSIEFISDPMVVDLDLDSGENTIAVKSVPTGSYNRVEFRVHRLDDDDPRDKAYFLHPDFLDFVEGNRFSIIIEGRVFENGSSTSFIFRSRENETQEHFLNPVLSVDENTVDVSVVLVINGSEWFLGENGSLLDPRISQNEDEISDNLERSIEVERGDRMSDDEDDEDDGSY